MPYCHSIQPLYIDIDIPLSRFVTSNLIDIIFSLRQILFSYFEPLGISHFSDFYFACIPYDNIFCYYYFVLVIID